MPRSRRRATTRRQGGEELGWGGFAPYVRVGDRKKKAAREIAARRKKGETISPIEIEGRQIAKTFWGKAWCDHLERYSDYDNRLPRGRTYVRNGSVVHLAILPGKVTALVQGSAMYTVNIDVKPVDSARWKAIVSDCTGKIDSVVELLTGKLSGSVMEVITRKEAGLFPASAQIKLRCSCPDSATMCKHVAAALYGVGARLDHQPELLFELRGADPAELVTLAAAGGILRAGKARSGASALAGADLSGMFGIDLDDDDDASPPAKPPPARPVTREPLAAPNPAAPARPAPKKPRAKATKAAPPAAPKLSWAEAAAAAPAASKSRSARKSPRAP